MGQLPFHLLITYIFARNKTRKFILNIAYCSFFSNKLKELTSNVKSARLLLRRVARIWKRGGGQFKKVRKVQTTLTRILIVLESVSHGLSENSDEISRKPRKFESFFRPKTGGLRKKKKKKVFAEIESDFSAKFGNSNVSGGAVFLWGGYFQFFTKNRPQKH